MIDGEFQTDGRCVFLQAEDQKEFLLSYPETPPCIILKSLSFQLPQWDFPFFAAGLDVSNSVLGSS